MSEIKTDDIQPAPQVELNDDELDGAQGGATSAPTTVKGIRDGTSNVIDGSSNT